MKDQVVGPYQVGDLIGRGGMGEVYRARDTKLDRDVALKVLPRDLGDDPERLARFEREAKVLASLQHQNIASIYGLEEFDGQPVLVMELVEGQDLSTVLESGPMGPEEASRTALQLAKGLEFAHDAGIVHRDLKPANVKVGSDGRVKILDFGLARAFSAEGVAEGESQDSYQPTITQGLTGAGTIMGTAAYMSPEQARGYNVDRRSDIWAFGVIVFEMLSGKRLFEGATPTDTLAAVLRHEPEWDDIPEDASPVLVQICRRCLEKDPRQRLRDIGEARVVLGGTSSSVLGLSTRALGTLPDLQLPSRRPWLPWSLVGVLAVALAAVGYLGFTGNIGPQPEPPRLVRSLVAMPEGVHVSLPPQHPGPVQVSPDGRKLVFSAVDSNGIYMLYLRELDRDEVRSIPGTEGGGYPFWSHDSRNVAFFTPNPGRLARVDLVGGPVTTICNAENGKGGSWNRFNQILLSPSHASPIFMVPVEGGEMTPVTDLGNDDYARSHRFPQWLPDGVHFQYVAVGRNPEKGMPDSIIRLGEAGGSSSKDLMPTQTNVVFTSDHVLFTHDGILMARPFDHSVLEFTAPAQPLTDGILMIQAAHLSALSAVDNGVLAYSSGATGFGQHQVIRSEADGSAEVDLGAPLLAIGISISPDGSRLAASLPDPQLGTFDIWVLDLERNLRNRVTFATHGEYTPVWSPDGKWLVYSSDVDGLNNLVRKSLEGAGKVEPLLARPQDLYPSGFSPDGRMLAYSGVDSIGRSQIGVLDLETGEAVLIHEGVTYSESGGTYSSDGRWLAYVSDETGNFEVYVESVAPGGGRWRVSSNGGGHPTWSPSNGRLVFIAPDGRIHGVPVTEQHGGLVFGQAELLVERARAGISRDYDVDKETGQIYFQRPANIGQSASIQLVTGWQSWLKDEEGVR